MKGLLGFALAEIPVLPAGGTMPAMPDPAIAEPLRESDPDRFLALLAAPPSARGVLASLYAFNLEVARAPWVTEEPMIAEMRLQWWRDALGEIGAGDKVRSHPVTLALAEVLDAEGAEALDRLVAARRFDIYREPHADGAAFDAYLDATAGDLHWTAARLLGAAREDEVRKVARASGLANLFLAVPDLEARGRMPLVDGRPEAVAGLAREALAGLRRARPCRAARPALLATWRAGGILARAAKDPARVAAGALEGSDFARRGGLLLRSLGL